MAWLRTEQNESLQSSKHVEPMLAWKIDDDDEDDEDDDDGRRPRKPTTDDDDDG